MNTLTDQSRRLAMELGAWLEVLDDDLASADMALPQRPLTALIRLFVHDIIEVGAGDEKLDGSDLSQHVNELWFQVLYAAVEYWYVERYGQAAMNGGDRFILEGVVLIRNAPYALHAPANGRKVEVVGEQAWMYFDEDVGPGEIPEVWIVDGPDLSLLEDAAHEHVRQQARIVASALRYVEFRRVTARADANPDARKLVISTLTYLEQAARRIAGRRTDERGPAWFDLQMANETALKAALQHATGNQPKTHDLTKLLNEAGKHGVVFDAARLETWPPFKTVSDWRYGQGDPGSLKDQFAAYLTTLDLVRAAMAQVPAGMKPGFGVLVRYAPWRLRDKDAESEPIPPPATAPKRPGSWCKLFRLPKWLSPKGNQAAPSY